jgi:hypothetical protein
VADALGRSATNHSAAKARLATRAIRIGREIWSTIASSADLAGS